MIPTLREIRGGASPSKFGGGQSRDIFRGGPVKKTTLYNFFSIYDEENFQAANGRILHIEQEMLEKKGENI